MAAETLTFSCPRCQARLNVPASMAGVSGPCPSCREQITAPRSSSPPSDKRKTAPIPRGAAADIAAGSLGPARGNLPAAESPRIRPEPRHLRERAQAQPIKPIRSTDDPLLSCGADLSSEPVSPGRRPYRLIHALFPATFLVLAGTLVGSLLYYYGPGGPGQRITDAFGPLDLVPPGKRPAAQPVESPPADTAARDPDPVEPPVVTTPSEPGKSSAIIANELLDSFLAAPDAASRLGMVEPPTTEQELAGTLLKGPLPEVARISLDLPQQHPEEQLTDYPYRVAFAVKDAPTAEFAVLVRQRGSQPPKVFLPAFLDLVGGRLAEFTRQPNRRPPATFHVYLEPIDGCYEKNVPGADRKFTLKLLPSPAGKETARAYAANVSRFRALVESPSYPIRWGMRRRATVTIQWNYKEDPARPFLELLEINSPDWNL